MYPAARLGDFVSHDDEVPCGIIFGPPAGLNPLSVFIEGKPAAHVTDGVLCAGFLKFGLVHAPIPPEPMGPPNKILKGSPTVFVCGTPAARWSPSFDMTTCLSTLGTKTTAASRTVFIGNGIPSMPIKIVIVGGTAYDSPEGKQKIMEMIAKAESVLGMAIQVQDMVVIDAPGLQAMEEVGYEIPTDIYGRVIPFKKQKVYSGQGTLDAIESHGSSGAPMALFSDTILGTDGGTSLYGQSIKHNAGNNKNEAILLSSNADLRTFAHELGHLLTNDLGHSDDVNNIMYGFGRDEDGHVVTGDDWTDPWKSEALNHRYLDKGKATVCPICGGMHE